MSIADAQILQQRASDPASHVWVSASAGSGKTTVLVARILRLLLDGVAPHRILCLTYTKAAAMEMRIRLARTLAEWASIPATAQNEKDKSLYGELKKFTGVDPSEEILKNARRLFAIISDAPDALRIQTIHSFCQSILSRFPIEAQLPPGFTALDEYQAAPLFENALDTAWRDHTGDAWQWAKRWCEQHYSMKDLQSLVTALLREWPEMPAVMDITGEDSYLRETFAALKMPQDEMDIWQGQFRDDAIPRAALLAWLEAKPNDALAEFLSADENSRLQMLDDYMSLFLKKDLEKLKNPVTKEVRKKIGDPQADELLAEQQRIFTLSERARDQRMAAASAAMGIVLARVGRAYQNIKSHRGALDFFDLIQKTHALLSSPRMGAWVHYKLDEGIDHVLVDEAQDTSRLQWHVIAELIEEYFAGQGIERTKRVFVVGDPKQSIYSFQGADPASFQILRNEWRERAAEAEAPWEDVPMRHSFRTSENLLALVDTVFAEDDKRMALQNTRDAITHETVHTGREGQIRIYPPVPNPPQQKRKGLLAGEDDGSEKHNALLAQQIARTIKAWISEGRAIASTGRAVEPKDILILLQQRTSMADAMLAALRNENIPVLGSDRLKLLAAAAVQDLLAFGRFLLLPNDDLNLAHLLRSPLVNMSEEKLLRVARRDQGVSLWQALLQSDAIDAAQYLQGWLGRADTDGAYDTLAEILARPCPAAASGWQAFHARLGAECDDPIQELLQLALREGQPDAPLGLENFIAWVEAAEIEVKREMAQHHENAARILTVHGAKGLEAPVVILADATEMNNRQAKSIKFDGRVPHFLFAPDKLSEGPAFDRSEKQLGRRTEYQRLLYVALTRAEHELHIFGKANKDGDIKEDRWYPQILAAAQALGATEENDIWHFGARDVFVKTPAKTIAVSRENQWLQYQAAPTPTPQRPMAVTEYLQQKYVTAMRPNVAAPLAQQRGTVMHRLLELLPNIAAERQEDSARRFIARQMPELDAAQCDAWTDEVMNILRAPEFAPFFAATAQAESAITGIWQNLPMIGVIDRFYVTEKEIYILDFKTAAAPPAPNDIPPQYEEQLQIYAQFLCELFPNRRVCAGILWTSILRMDWLDQGKLQAAA